MSQLTAMQDCAIMQLPGKADDTGAFYLESLRVSSQLNTVVDKAPCLSGVPRAALPGGAGLRWTGGFVMAEINEAAFWSKVDRSGECWIWTGSRDAGGYGRIKVKGKYISTHRLAWAMTKGSSPAELCVCHHCDNPSCVRPCVVVEPLMVYELGNPWPTIRGCDSRIEREEPRK